MGQKITGRKSGEAGGYWIADLRFEIRCLGNILMR